MKSDPSPFPADASYVSKGAPTIGQQPDRESDLIGQLQALRRQAHLATLAAAVQAVGAGGLFAWFYPMAAACAAAFILLVAFVAGGTLFLIHRGDPEMGVR